MLEKQPLKRPCKRCSNYFSPTGKGSKLCEKCNLISKKTRGTAMKKRAEEAKKKKLEEKYLASKIELNLLRDNITLERWKILSKAYKMGKQIWGNKFTKSTLAHDMDMPSTTVLRCLSLDRCNKKTWKLIEEKKISVFKVAQVCMSKNKKYHDELVKMVIEDNLSTHQISSLRVDGIEDVDKERHRLAIEQGYSRKDSAYSNFRKWIERGQIFMLMNKDKLPDSKVDEIKAKLKRLNKMIASYTDGN